MNWVKANRAKLEQSNYVLKADTSSNYWFGISQKKLNEYSTQFDSSFDIILFGNAKDEGDFYRLPFLAIRDLLTEENLYFFEGKRKRWVGDIRNHILRIRNSKVERNISEYFSIPKTYYKTLILQKDNLNDYAIENARREIKVRVKQSGFRKKVLKNFNYQCCLTAVKETELLVASHIIPWASKIETRLSPHNGLCLSVLYDSLFDEGYFTFDELNKVIITSRIKSLSKQMQHWLSEISGREMALSQKYEISTDALEYHRNNIFNK